MMPAQLAYTRELQGRIADLDASGRLYALLHMAAEADTEALEAGLDAAEARAS